MNKIKSITYKDLFETAALIPLVNPYMKDKSHNDIVVMVKETVERNIRDNNSCFVATAGWLALIEEEKRGVYYVEMFIQPGMAMNYIKSLNH